jgi:hypothetical protein
MGRNFPSRRIRHRVDVWRDRRRHPWLYAETEARRFGRRRAMQTTRRRFFVVRSVEDGGRFDHYVFAECPNYASALEVAALGDDRVFTEGQMLDHPERLRVLSAWDRSEGRQRTRRPRIDTSRRRATGGTLSGIEVGNG